MAKNTRVFVVSPYRGDVEKNRRYAFLCVRDCIQRGESPFAGHLFYTLFLDDNVASDRAAGMSAGQDWLLKSDVVAAYMDLGASSGMIEDMAFAKKHKIRVEERNLSRIILERLGK